MECQISAPKRVTFRRLSGYDGFFGAEFVLVGADDPPLNQATWKQPEYLVASASHFILSSMSGMPVDGE